MEICLYACNIETKLYCCREHPETGKAVPLTLADGRKAVACPNLNKYGGCNGFSSIGEDFFDRTDDDGLPGKCISYECARLNTMDLVTRRELTERLRSRR